MTELCQHEDCELPAVATWNGGVFCDAHVRERLRTTADRNLEAQLTAALNQRNDECRMRQAAEQFAGVLQERVAKLEAEQREVREAYIEQTAQLLDTQYRIAELESAMRFCRDVATEEYAHQGSNAGAEAALRHIMNRADNILAGKP